MEEQNQQQLEKPKKKRKKWPWIVGGVILFFIIIVAIMPVPENENINTNTTTENKNIVLENTDQTTTVSTNEESNPVVENIPSEETNTAPVATNTEEINTTSENSNQEAESPINVPTEEDTALLEEQQPTEGITFVFQESTEFQKDSAESTLAEYVKAWKDQDWDKMTNYVQLTWKDGKNDPAGELEAWYGYKIPLKGFEITDVTKVSDVTSDITFTVQYEAITDQISKKQITARIIKETAPYTPSEQGQWGINPISTFTEKDVD